MVPIINGHFSHQGLLHGMSNKNHLCISFEKLSHLKFRAIYGVTGNSEIGIYQSLANFSSSLAVIGEQPVNAVTPSTVENADLSRESTRQPISGSILVSLMKG